MVIRGRTPAEFFLEMEIPGCNMVALRRRCCMPIKG